MFLAMVILSFEGVAAADANDGDLMTLVRLLQLLFLLFNLMRIAMISSVVLWNSFSCDVVWIIQDMTILFLLERSWEG